MKGKAIGQNEFFKSALGAAVAVLCGLMLWKMPLCESWVNASYDYLFRFGARAVTNRVTLILMDNEAFDHFHQIRGQPWDRGLHAQLLNRLADDGCALVVFDSFFRQPRDPTTDEALAEAMRRQQHIVLMAEQAQVTHPDAGRGAANPAVGTISQRRRNELGCGLAGSRPRFDCAPALAVSFAGTLSEPVLDRRAAGRGVLERRPAGTVVALLRPRWRSGPE